MNMERIQFTQCRSTVVGIVQTLNDLNSIEFVLYDAIFGRQVHCYVTEETKYLLKDISGKRVTVIGIVVRQSDTGYLFKVIEIEDIIIAPKVVERQFEDARGILADLSSVFIDERSIVTCNKLN